MKDFQLALRVAWIHLISRKRQSIVAMLGVTFGISMFIVMISFMNGVNEFIMELSLDGSPHIHIYDPVQINRAPIASARWDTATHWILVHHQRPKNEPSRIRYGPQVLKALSQEPEVQWAAPEYSTQVFFNNGPLQFTGIIIGCDPPKENAMFKLYEKLEGGNIDKWMTDREGLLMGQKLAQKMNVTIGDRVSFTTPAGTTFLMKVDAIFAYGITAIDDNRCYAHIKTVQKIMGKNQDFYSDINIRLYDYTKAGILAPKLEKKYNYRAEDWETTNASLLAGQIIRNTLTMVVSITMLIVAGFGIYNIMNMTIVNKMRDIAILKATGFEGKDIVSIFLFQSIIIGIIGGLIGVMLGILISYGISRIPFPESSFIRIETFPVSFRWQYYVMGMFFGFLTTLLAGYFPAKKASSVDPVAIIRG